MKYEVKTPSDDFLATPSEKAIWDSYGRTHNMAVRAVGVDMAFSLAVSRISRELRRNIGWEGARDVFLGIANTQEEASKGDREGD